MPRDWDGLESVEAVERVLRAAVSSGAREIHLSVDREGATLFFLSEERIEFFDHVPVRCRDGMRAYLKTLGGIDTWQTPPAKGFGVFRDGEGQHEVEVRTLKGSLEEDVIVRLTSAT